MLTLYYRTWHMLSLFWKVRSPHKRKKQRNKIWRFTAESACLSWSSLIRLVNIFRTVNVIHMFISLFEKARHRIIPVCIFTTLSKAFWIVHRRAGKFSLLFQAFKALIWVKSRHDFIMQRMLVTFKGILYLLPSLFWYVDASLYILDLSSFVLCYLLIHLRLPSK